MNICGCGAQAGYPHHPACPRPLFRGSEADWDRWERELARRLEELEHAEQQSAREILTNLYDHSGK